MQEIILKQLLSHSGVEMKKIFVITAILFLLTIGSVFALSMTAGTVRILVDVGSSNSSSFGFINDGNETITLKIRAEGDAAQFIEIPKTLDLVPNKFTDLIVKATIPSTYDGSLGGNITGTIFAVQEGTPGQVQINIQASKAVQILIPQYGGKLPEIKTQTVTTETTSEKENSITGFASLLGTNSLLLILIFAVVLILAFIVLTKRFEISIKPKGVKE